MPNFTDIISSIIGLIRILPATVLIEIPHLYGKIDDLLRTRLICKYMDGPKYVCDRLARYCDAHGISAKFRELSTDAGYYAWHFYFQVPVQISILNKVEDKRMWIELQLSTQLAEVIHTLTHGLYEARRVGGTDAKKNYWKWDAGSQMFRAAYIGHGLHLLEGIIQSYKDEVLGIGASEAIDTPSEPADLRDSPLPTLSDTDKDLPEREC